MYFRIIEQLINKGILSGKISSFDADLYDKLDNTFINGLPVSLHIKYLKNSFSGNYYDRSLYMFYCFDDATLVKGCNHYINLRYNSDEVNHGWIEDEDYVYDPSLMMKFDKDYYYEVFNPSQVQKCSKEEYLSVPECKRIYDEIKNTKIEDYMPGGSKRDKLYMTIPLVMDIAKNSCNKAFLLEFNEYLKKIDYKEYTLVR